MKPTQVETIHIFVEVNKTDHRKVELPQDQVTGREIKTAARIPLEDDLARRVQGKLELVTNEEVITIKNGDHFVALPAGTIS